MRIVYLHQYFNTPQMYGGTRSYEMARRMVSAGHEVHMITSNREHKRIGQGWRVTHEAGINVHWYPVPYSNKMSYRQRIVAFLSFALAAKKRAGEIKGDVIFASSTPLTIAIPAVPAARRRNIPLVFEVRDLWPEMPIAMGALKNPLMRYAARKLERWAYHNAASIVALSPGMKDGVVSTGYPAKNVAVIPNSSDNAEFKHDSAAAAQFRKERPWLADKPLLVYAGTFGRVNGVGYMVELAKELLLIGSDIRILMVGDGQERSQIIQSAKTAGVFEVNLYFEAQVAKNQIPKLLSAATVTSNIVIDIPEAHANSANKFFDALAAGKPVLLNHGGWMHDLVQAHDCGLAMWHQPVPLVARELEEKMHNQTWLECAGTAARSLAENDFDRDKLSQKLLQVLQAAVDSCPDQAESIAPGKYV